MRMLSAVVRNVVNQCITPATLLSLVIVSSLVAGPSGKISGKITDARTGESLPSVNVQLVGTTIGAITDINGNYVILNVPPGVYTVVASYIGYQKTEVREVRVSADFTTTLDLKLIEGSVEMAPVIVQGERNPLIRKDLTNPMTAISSEQIEALPVDNVSDVIRLQAGVVVDNSGDLHIRGGRANEIAYSVNGISINNPLNNNQSIGLATNALQEISVSTGTFSAEYGDALSGVINYVTKEGGEKYSGSLKFYSGDQLSGRSDLFYNINTVNTANHWRGEGTLGGPVLYFERDASFFLSGVYTADQGYLYGVRLFRPTDSYLVRNEFPSTDTRYAAGGDTLAYVFNPYSLIGNGQPTGDGAIVPMDTRQSANLTAKLSYRLASRIKLTYDYLLSRGTSRGFSQAYRFNPDGRSTFRSLNQSHTVTLTQTLTDRMFYTLKFGYNSTEGKNFASDNIFDQQYLPAFYARSLSNTAFLTGGTSSDRTRSKTNSTTVKFDMVAQLFDIHELRFGGELRKNRIDIESYVLDFDKTLPAQLLQDPARSYTQFIPTPEVAPDNLSYANYSRRPSQASLYILDKIELMKSLILNLGVRYEYFDPSANYIPDLGTTLTNQGAGLKLVSSSTPASVKTSLAPRFSVSYPITDQGVIRFSYGHFYQYPTYVDPGGNLRLSTIYRNPDFNAPSSSNPSFGNANLKPQRSIQYEVGLQQGLADDIKMELTGFYKDVTDYIEVQSVRTGLGDRVYTVLANLNYANVKGVGFSLFKRRSPGSLLSASLDYTYTAAIGNRTDADAFLFDEKTGQQSEKLFVPLGFDRSHVVNGTLTLSEPGDWTASAIGTYQTGSPYTPALPTNLAPVKFDQNSARRPTNWNVDLHLEKYFTLSGLRFSLFLRVDNVFDIKNEIFIFENSGSSLYSIDQVLNAHLFDDLRKRIGRGDFGNASDPSTLGGRLTDALDKYYQRAEWVGPPREIRLGWSVLF